MNASRGAQAVPLRATASGGRRMLRIDQVTDRLAVGRTTVYALVSTAGFPKPVRVSPGRVAWPEDEVDAWLAARVAAQRQQAGS